MSAQTNCGGSAVVLGSPMEIPTGAVLGQSLTRPFMLARCRVLFDKVVDVPCCAAQMGFLRVQKTVEVVSTCASGAHPRTNYGAGCRCPSATTSWNDGSGEKFLAKIVCVLRGCAGVDVVAACFPPRTNSACSGHPFPKCPSRSVVTEVHSRVACSFFRILRIFLDFFQLGKSSKNFPR